MSERTRLQSRVEELRKKVERSRGEIDFIEARLKKEYGCTPDQATKILAKMRKEIDELSSQLEEGFAKWDESWGEGKR